MSERVTPECPLSCLDLSPAAALALRKYGSVETVGDLIELTERRAIGLVRHIGTTHERDIKVALLLGFTFAHRNCHRDDKESVAPARPGDGLLTTTEVCKLFRGAVPLDVRRWCHAGLTRYVKDPLTRRYLIREHDVRILAERTAGQAPNQSQLRELVRERQQQRTQASAPGRLRT